MIYKILTTNEDGVIYGRIDDDGLCRVTCTAQHQPFLDALANGVELQDADGKVIDGKAYLKTLENT